MSSYSHDLEKNPAETGVGSIPSETRPYAGDDGAVPGESFEYGNSFFAKVQRLAGKLKIEQRGIERVPEDERTDVGFKALLNVSTMVSFPPKTAWSCSNSSRSDDDDDDNNNDNNLCGFGNWQFHVLKE